jgi:hypothetical protein
MVIKKKTDFLLLIQDEEFINLVQKSAHSDELLSELIKKYPGNRDEVLYAFEFIRVNRSDKMEMDSGDYDKILTNIQTYLKEKKEFKYRRFYLLNIWKAAVVFLVLSFSSLFIYHEFSKNSFDRFIKYGVYKGDQALLVLSEGSLLELSYYLMK